MERDCESELSKLNIEQNACIYHFGASVIHGQRSNILRLLWIESSLKISPKEQVEVMERIFGTDSTYSERTQNILKQVMLISEENNTEISIYGKTGMGKAEGIVVDAWFTGFAETLEGNKYFCVYLGQSDAGNTSSTAAKEIAIQILNDNK